MVDVLGTGDDAKFVLPCFGIGADERMGFEVVREGDYSTILRSADKTILLSVDKYTPADIQLNFISQQGEIYPLWMIRLIIDMESYDVDKDKLNRIQTEYGLRDGCEGMTQFRKGVKLYAATYMELATKFLQKNLYLHHIGMVTVN